MSQYNLDALLLTEEENLTYFSGLRKVLPNLSKARVYQTYFLILPRGAAPVLILPLQMRGNAEAMTWIDDVRFSVAGLAAMKPVDVLRLTVETMEEMNLADKAIGMEFGDLTRLDLSQNDFEAVKRGLPKARLVDCSELIWRLRMVKSPGEIECIRRASAMTCKAMEATLGSMKEGMTEREIARAFYKMLLDEGCEDTPLKAFISIRAGPTRYGMWDSRPSDTKIKRGDIIVLDGGTNFKGYSSDMIRLASVGKPSKKQQEMFEVALRAQEAAIQAVRSGTTCGEVYNSAAKVAEKAGYLKSLYATGCGHGIGLLVHEPPSLAKGSKVRLEPGMVLCVEPAFYDDKSLAYIHRGGRGKGEHGVFMVEDTVAVTQTGHESLTPIDKSLRTV